MKLLWTGTDSLMLVDYSRRRLRKKVYWQLFRWFIRPCEIFIQEHYCDADNVASHLKEFGFKKPVYVVPDRFDPRKYKKLHHVGVNVLYYFPRGGDRVFREWLYGYDLFLLLKIEYPHLNFIEVDGTYEMNKIYPIVDFYLRCNRHDGASRMRQECEINEIPYYWSQTDPDYDAICKALDTL